MTGPLLEIRTFNQNLYYFFSDQFQSSESCDCKTVNSCKWSREALLEINGLSRRDPKRNNTIKAIQEHICDKKSRLVYCCGKGQQPPSDIELNGDHIKIQPMVKSESGKPLNLE